MGRSPKPGIDRRERLLKILRQNASVDTSELSASLGVSEMTIRRDLKVLEDQDKIFRNYGGATLASRLHLEFEFNEHRQRGLPAKQAIARFAAGLVERDETIFVDVGTTTLEFARELRRRDVPCTVATSSLAVGSELWGQGHIHVFMLGGQLRDGSPDLTGDLCEHSLELLNASKAFVGCDALDPQRGCLASDDEGASVSKTMLRFAGWCCILSDASKLNRRAPVSYAGLDEIDLLVMDDAVPADTLATLRERVARVEIVTPDKDLNGLGR